jgi:azobenzene reductase
MKIVVISGSNRMGSKSRIVAERVMERLLQRPGVEAVLLDVAHYNFPVLEERWGIHPQPPQGMEEFSTHLSTAGAIVVVTPEYNGGMAGSLKNTLDYFRREFVRKPMAAVTVTSGTMGGVNALHQLWYWMLYVGALASPGKLMVSEVQTALEQPESAPGERLARGIEKCLDDLIWLALKVA